MAHADGLPDPAKMQQYAPQLLGLPGYTYRFTAVSSGEAGPTTPASALPLAGQPGTRLPHCWLDEATTTSTLDWCRGQFILVVSGEAAPWQAALLSAALPCPLAVHELPAAARPAWQHLTRTQGEEALLVRPDGFVAARLAAVTTAAELAAHLRQLLALAP